MSDKAARMRDMAKQWVLVRPCISQKANGNTKPSADNGCWYIRGSRDFLEAMQKRHDDIGADGIAAYEVAAGTPQALPALR